MRSFFLARLLAVKAAFGAYHHRFRREPKLAILQLLGWILLAVVFGAFFRSWWQVYSEALTDPHLQTDDARTALFAFHRYGPGAPLASDPIANEMLEYQPYAYRLIYRIWVPLVGLLAAAKVAQALCLAILLWAAVVLARSKRAGVGVAAIFLFLFMHDSTVMNRIGGGLPRSFGFPAMALWMAGAIAHSRAARRAAAVIAALTYPSALAMVLGAEGLYVLRRFARPSIRTALHRLKQYGILVAVCAALFAPTALMGGDGGPVHTLQQAEQEPAFSKSGRLWVLPLAKPGEVFGEHLLKPLRPWGDSPLNSVTAKLSEFAAEWSAAAIGIILVLFLAGVSPAPGGAIAFTASALALYAASVVLAFRLYSPERYYSYGMHVACIGLATSAYGLFLPRLRWRLRQPVRVLGSAAIVFSLWIWLGPGGVSRNAMAMTINYSRKEPMWRFLRTLPADSTRIASFMMDGDDIPLFAARANNGGFETLQPWLTKSWARQKERAQHTLRAFYTTNQKELFDYCKQYEVTHLLVNRARYHGDFVRKSATFQPLTDYARTLLENRRLEDLILARVPKEAVIFEHGDEQIVDVKLLAQAWNYRY